MTMPTRCICMLCDHFPAKATKAEPVVLCAHCGKEIDKSETITHWERCEHHPARKAVERLHAQLLDADRTIVSMTKMLDDIIPKGATVTFDGTAWTVS